ncbi:SIR2 family protein [Rhodoblastus acidophilus]|uniref:SIR2 family protein n=1 Tax=Candidatus Rhodoblastus alkanivorans TaxID=2954117 RepID=A0ABS9Z9S7_9HYPH|nr:SIR2 family protein [Candidatus Rhodoblastus alkanivorans]MCI4677096.1 SIR2 family protein [Candidatus Rhodoblastus alkanivorans]MCI4684449.1 SIR2 family protein [Candidatus Rhodoblastus alkanivorans]MDI4641770.1 SIR2 family protein [Rhodoblastus acidophilus]
MNAAILDQDLMPPQEAEKLVATLSGRLRAGEIIPYVGPGLAALSTPSVPLTPEDLAAFFGTKVALPRRAKGNAWAAGQHIESFKHRSTVTALMAEAFSAPVAPTPLHAFLASLPLPLIVDTWYDGAFRAALETRDDWGEIQGNTRAGVGEDRWYRFYDAKENEASRDDAEGWKTILYKPHGGVQPAKNFLISDADYVEVLTEIDIQTPIPDVVKNRRAERSFLFLGCRFHDQMLRTYARQISKRSAAPHYAVVDRDQMTANERRFFASEGIVPIALPLARVCDLLVTA